METIAAVAFGPAHPKKPTQKNIPGYNEDMERFRNQERDASETDTGVQEGVRVVTGVVTGSQKAGIRSYMGMNSGARAATESRSEPIRDLPPLPTYVHTTSHILPLLMNKSTHFGGLTKTPVRVSISY